MVTTNFELQGALRLLRPIVMWLYGGMWSRGLKNLMRMMEAGEF